VKDPLSLCSQPGQQPRSTQVRPAPRRLVQCGSELIGLRDEQTVAFCRHQASVSPSDTLTNRAPASLHLTAKPRSALTTDAPATAHSLGVGWLDSRLMYCHCEHMSTIKEERLQIRVGPADKALLERAAAASHLNVSAFVIQAAATKAEEILAERSSVRLSPQAAIAFTEALERPAEVNHRLVQALRRKRKFGWLD
jgi:uncharacterized protein (DUF1778 family)